MIKYCLFFLLGAFLLKSNGYGQNLPSSTSYQTRRALVIGNNHYANCPLINPGNDVDSVASALRQLGFTVDAGKNLTFLEMRRAINSFFKKLKKDDVYLLYYAGYGVRTGGNNFLVPIDATYAQGLDKNDCLEVQSMLSDSLNATGIILLDTHFRALDSTRFDPDIPPDNALIVYSGIGKVLDFSDDCRQNSPFSAAFVHFLKTQAHVSLEEHQQQEVHDLLRLVNQRVISTTQNVQHPLVVSRLATPFYFHLYSSK
jgi:hypothetical protein